MTIKKWHKISSKIVYSHPRMTLAEDEVLLPTGKKIYYLRQLYNGEGGVIVICRQDDKILVQREYSYPVDEVLYQLPGGRIESGETPLQAAKRELAEESGLDMANLQHLGWFYADNRRTSAKLHVVYGEVCGKDNDKKPDDEEYIVSEWVLQADIASKIANGDVNNYAMLAAWALFMQVH